MSVIYKVVKCKIYMIKIIRETETRWFVGNIRGYGNGYIIKTNKSCFTQIEPALALLEKNLEKELSSLKEKMEELSVCKDATIDGRKDVLVKFRRLTKMTTYEERRRRNRRRRIPVE